MKRLTYLFGQLILCLTLILSFTIKAQITIKVQANNKIAPIQPSMWGIFFEDINFALDGGLYAELVKNRSFEFDKPLMGWTETKNDAGSGDLQILNRSNENNNNPRYLRIIKNSEVGQFGISNEGFRGMGIKQGNTYHFSVWARSVKGNPKLKIELFSADGKSIATAEIIANSYDWKKYQVELISSKTDPKAKLSLTINSAAIIDVDFVSLFPNDTWKNRPGGLRADLVQLLADLKPGFVRFPGGCVVEGRNLSERYQWKNTITDIENRKVMVNRWNMEFAHRQTPDYFQSFGIGFYEYFLLSEDLKSEPLPILSCGMACQYNTGELAELDDMQPYIQDAIDLVEFANGDSTSIYGKIRAKMRHPAPFNLHYIGIGNEQWGSQYVERYKIMSDALQKVHPEIKIVGSVGPSASGNQFNYLWGEMEKFKPFVVDEHYYMSPEWFLKNAKRYDNYDRNNPKVFVGEFAAQSLNNCNPDNKNNWQTALSEGAYMTGLERNADVVYMASYAPLFGHVDGWQWKPNLIWFDNLKSFGTANYQVQKLFSTNKGTHIIPATIDSMAVTGNDGIYASAAIDEKTKEIIVKIANTNAENKDFIVEIAGVKVKSKEAKTISLKNNDLNAENTIEKSDVIIPVMGKATVKSNKILLNLESYSIVVVNIGY